MRRLSGAEGSSALSSKVCDKKGSGC
jgi:hypothetical protein